MPGLDRILRRSDPVNAQYDDGDDTDDYHHPDPSRKH